MSGGETRRYVVWVLRIAIAAAVVAAVVALTMRDDDPPAEQQTAPPSAAATSAPATPAEFCAAFRAFAEANSQYVAAPDATTTEALRSTGLALAGLTDPVGLSPEGQASLQQEIAGALVAIGEDVTVRDDVEPDAAAYEEYLATACPA